MPSAERARARAAAHARRRRVDHARVRRGRRDAGRRRRGSPTSSTACSPRSAASAISTARHRFRRSPSSTARCSPAGARSRPKMPDAVTDRGAARISTSSRPRKRGGRTVSVGAGLDPRRRAQRQRAADRRRRCRVRRLDEHVHRRGLVRGAGDAAVDRARRRRRTRGRARARSGSATSTREQVVPVVAAIAGYFAERGRLPDPPGLPTLRPFQRAQGEVANAWLRRLWDRADASRPQSDQCRPMPISQSPFSSGMIE